MHYPMALDAKRWNLSPMPEALNYAGAVLIPIKGLPGYGDYAARVRYRLIPGVW